MSDGLPSLFCVWLADIERRLAAPDNHLSTVMIDRETSSPDHKKTLIVPL